MDDLSAVFALLHKIRSVKSFPFLDDFERLAREHAADPEALAAIRRSLGRVWYFAMEPPPPPEPWWAGGPIPGGLRWLLEDLVAQDLEVILKDGRTFLRKGRREPTPDIPLRLKLHREELIAWLGGGAESADALLALGGVGNG